MKDYVITEECRSHVRGFNIKDKKEILTMEDNAQSMAYQLEIEQRDLEDNCFLITSDDEKSERIRLALYEIKDLKSEIKCLQEREEFLKDFLKDTLNNKEFLVDKSTGSVIATYKKHINQTFDVLRFAKEMPTVYGEFIINKVRRTLLIK
jgi:hypothetical protein